MKFIDEARIYVRSGHGGRGCSSFHREKFVPLGGPNGGNGGRGAHVIFRAHDQLDTLLDFRYQREYLGKDGGHGEPNLKTGADAPDLIVPVPVGTRLMRDDGELLADLIEDGQEYTAVKGGRGGKGNNHFKSSTRQAPTHAQPGENGEDLWICLELQLLADVGLLGFPNAGKSTLIRTLSSATPKVADYPFTTLAPNLGVIQFHEKRFVMADLPGLIEGAHEGKGLGDRFLRHLSRNRVLLYVLAADGEHEPPEAFDALRYEVEKYESELLSRPFVIAVSKCDICPEGTEMGDKLLEWVEKLKQKSEDGAIGDCAGLVQISGLAHLGLTPLLEALYQALIASGRWKPAKKSIDAFPDPDEEYNPLTFSKKSRDK